MRKKLKNIKGERKQFTGIFDGFGEKKNYHGFFEKTVLLKDVKLAEDQKELTDHLWFNYTKGFQELDLVEGDIVQFNARVTSYTKGYQGHREDVFKIIEFDYKLSHPSKVKKV